MPGHIGTSIFRNSRKVLSGNFSDTMTPAEIAAARARMAGMGLDTANMSDEAIVRTVEERSRRFIEEAPMTAAQASKIILDGVKAGHWRILVGEDALRLDEAVRREPERAYDEDFYGPLLPTARGS
jgi:hypothetical protein